MDGEVQMKVEFTIYTRSGKKASGGILVYKHANKSGLTPDAIDSNGYGKSCKTPRSVWYMSACNGILTGHEAKQP